MQIPQFGSKIKIAKKLSKSTLQIIYSSCVPKTARKNTKYSRNESILKIGDKTRKNDMTWACHIHIKKANSNWWYINLHDDSFQSESPCKRAKKSQTSLRTPHILF